MDILIWPLSLFLVLNKYSLGAGPNEIFWLESARFELTLCVPTVMVPFYFGAVHLHVNEYHRAGFTKIHKSK